MNAPLFDAVDAYVKRDAARFHMPGHKGKLPWLDELAGGIANYDITEVDGCDVLYAADSAIAQTERQYADLYGSSAALLSAGGATLCIQAMLALAAKPRHKLICGRGCHAAAINAMALLDILPEWIFPETDAQTGLAQAVTADAVAAALELHPDAAAVYLTSPDYYGAICDVAAIAAVCHARGAKLLIDNAHGAHLRFLRPPWHPIHLGADMCCDSLHKSLPVLTGGAVLHLKDAKLRNEAKRCMSLFGSTSPSYLVLLSIDRALDVLTADFPARLQATAEEVARLEHIARAAGFLVPAYDRDPLRLTLGFAAMGYETDAFLRRLRESGIEPEMVSAGYAVLMASPDNRPEDFARLTRFLTELPRQTPVPLAVHPQPRPERALELRAATLAACVEISLDEAVGRIAASVVAPCPPGIPLTVPGERICEKLQVHLKNYGISRLNVVK